MNTSNTPQKPKLKIWFPKTERAVAFQVLEQDERFRSNKYTANNGVTVQSAFDTCLSPAHSVVFLRGAGGKAREMAAHAVDFQTNYERDVYHGKVLEALKDWAANAPQFKASRPEAITYNPRNMEHEVQMFGKGLLILHVELFYKGFALQIREQDESLVVSYDGYTAPNGITIGRNALPCVGANSFWLRGATKGYDDQIISLTFASNADRDTYLKRLYDALDAWASHELSLRNPRFQAGHMVQEGDTYTFY